MTITSGFKLFCRRGSVVWEFEVLICWHQDENSVWGHSDRERAWKFFTLDPI